MFKNLAGSIIETIDGCLWYCCDNWKVNNILNVIPCILSYIPEKNKYNLSRDFFNKHVNLKGKEYHKVFGQPLDIYRKIFYKNNKNIYDGFSLGKVAFIKKEYIKNIKNPISFVNKFIELVPNDGRIFKSLIKIFELENNQVGISGSCLLFDKPVKRHEVDFVVYGAKECIKVYRMINKHKSTGTFSEDKLEKFYLPFKFKNVWFDPQFACSCVDRHIIDNSIIDNYKELDNVQLTILDNTNGIFFPAVYLTNIGKIISFRPGHRGLFKNNDILFFRKIQKAIITYSTGTKESIYVIMNDEWCEIIQTHN